MTDRRSDIPSDPGSDEETFEVFERYPTLAGVGRLTSLIERCPWFRAVGDPMSKALMADSQSYCDALGFPEAQPAILPLWEDAAGAAESIDLNSPAWEAEELMRMAVLQDALAEVDEETLELVLTHIAAKAAQSAEAAAQEVRDFLLIDDEAFVRAATGAAVQMCHQAALLLASGGDPDHAISYKFRIFEHGRWPVGIMGGTLNIF
ncbi:MULTISPECIES: hypothetical protein [unclassified Iodidimonas]|uniref:hypothetical protein n=1 Tax=unclassified Iodidimonas TaxID=2626145 RepID=UPI002482C534|nr:MULTISPECIES: hypothetical protein [unclassified Iodidimonas]